MVTVGVTEKTDIPTVVYSQTSVFSDNNISSNTNGFVNTSGTPFTLPNGNTLFYHAQAYNGTGGPTLYAKIIDSITGTNIVSQWVGGGSTTYRVGSYTNTSGSDMTVQMQHNYNGSGYATCYFNSALVMDATNIALCEELDLAGLGSGTTQLTRNQKQYINKWYVICQNSSSSITIDGIKCSFGNNPTVIDVGTISNSQTFNWSYNSYNKVFIAFTGAKFTVSA